MIAQPGVILQTQREHQCEKPNSIDMCFAFPAKCKIAQSEIQIKQEELKLLEDKLCVALSKASQQLSLHL